VIIKKAICHSGNPARIIRNPVESIASWIPDNRYAVSGMTKRINGTMSHAHHDCEAAVNA